MTNERYAAWVAADDAWQAELERLFGANAGEVRYTAQGRTGPTLAPLYAEARRAAERYTGIPMDGEDYHHFGEC